MITTTEIRIKQLSDYEKVGRKIEDISPQYIDRSIIEMLKQKIGLAVELVVVEYPYYDRDYLSTYYLHYAQKLKSYPKECIRLHFFRSSRRKNKYEGYMVLRPLYVDNNKIGHTVLSPSIVLNEPAFLMLCDTKVHLVGTDYHVEAFPWMKQDTDITTCAHVALWSLLRFFGLRFSQYENPSLGNTIEKVREEWGRKVPSHGLNAVQVSSVLSEYGLYPIIRSKRTSVHQHPSLIAEMFAYLESGIPIIGMSQSIEHAFSIIGHGKVYTERLKTDIHFRERIKEPGTNCILHSSLINSVYVMDDNLFPYRKLERMVYAKSDTRYSMHQISYIIVPLYARVQLEYHDVYTRFRCLIQEGEMEWHGDRIVRIYLTSENAVKRHAMNVSNMNNELADILRWLNMSRFVWCIDISTIEEYDKHEISGRVLIDSTAGSKDLEPWILMHDRKKIRFREDNVMQEQLVNIDPYEEFVHNLYPVGESKYD